MDPVLRHCRPAGRGDRVEIADHRKGRDAGGEQTVGPAVGRDGLRGAGKRQFQVPRRDGPATDQGHGRS